MNAFDRAMNHLDKAYSFSDNEHQYVSRKVPCSPHSEASGIHQHSSKMSLWARFPSQCDVCHALSFR